MKIEICNKLLWKKFFESIAIISAFFTIFSIFINIPNDNKKEFFFVFFGVLVVIFLFLYYKANVLKILELKINNNKVIIRMPANIFDNAENNNSLIVIPVNEYFDTMLGKGIISEGSIHGQFIKSKYKDNIVELTTLVDEKLINIKNEINPNRNIERNKKYTLGTTINLDNGYVLTALSHFDENNCAKLSKNQYLNFLNIFWDELIKVYQGEKNIIIPLFGSGITRMDNKITGQDFLEQILNSIKMSNIKLARGSRITILIHEDSVDEIDLYKIQYLYKGE